MIVRAHAGILETRRSQLPVGGEAGGRSCPSGADRAWLVNRLRALVGLEAPPAEREENFTAWLRFLEQLASDAPLVLVFEDLHWADEGLLAFVEYLAARLGAVPLLLRRYRPTRAASSADPAFAAEGAGWSRIPLGPLCTPRDARGWSIVYSAGTRHPTRESADRGCALRRQPVLRRGVGAAAW